MAILFDWFENPRQDTEQETTLHVRPCFNGVVKTETLIRHIRQRCSLTPGDILAVLSELNEVIGEELREGRQVHVEGLGYFAPTLEVTEKVTPDMPLKVRNRKVRFKDVRFRMDKSLRKAVGTPHLNMTRWETHSASHTDEAMESKLTAYFAEHDFITRRNLEFLLGLKKNTALRLLQRLRQEEKLTNRGTERQPIYVPLPGHFGK